MRNKIAAVLVAVGMMVSVVNAADVTKFKIDGIGLGDNYDKVKKKLPCNDDISSSGYMSCEKNNVSIKIQVNKNRKIYFFSKVTTFDTEPDWEKISDSAIAIYGNPDIVGSDEYKDSSDRKTYRKAWGNCKTKNMGRYFTDSSADIECVGKYLQFSYGKQNGNWFYESIKLDDTRAYKQALENNTDKQNMNKTASTSTSTLSSWSLGFKTTNKDSYNPQSSNEATDIKCSNGNHGTIFNFYNRDTSYRYIVNTTKQFQSFDEAANYICGNR